VQPLATSAVRPVSIFYLVKSGSIILKGSWLSFIALADGVVAADCSQMIIDNPTCADPSWVLFTQLDGPETLGICCPVGMVVDVGLECASPGGTGVSSQISYYTTVSLLSPGECLSSL
jgi:hypothetical protein